MVLKPLVELLCHQKIPAASVFTAAISSAYGHRVVVEAAAVVQGWQLKMMLSKLRRLRGRAGGSYYSNVQMLKGLVVTGQEDTEGEQLESEAEDVSLDSLEHWAAGDTQPLGSELETQ